MQVIALLCSGSLAADPLVATGAIPDALRQASAGAGRPESSFTPVAWSDLVARPPGLVGEGSWVGCTGARSTSAQLTLAVDGAEGALGYGDLEKATSEVREADRLAAYLDADPTPGLLARWHLVRGATGETASLALARALDPALRWGASWPPEGAAAFEAAAAPTAVPVAIRAFSGGPGGSRARADTWLPSRPPAGR